MSDDFRRRRRLSNSGSPRRGGGGNNVNPWIVTVFAALAVIAGGWFLGQALARVFNGPPKTERVAQAPTSQPVVTPPASASPAASPAASESPSAAPSATPKPTPEPTPTATASPTAAPIATAAPTQAPAAAATQAAIATPTAAAAAAATATPSTRRTQPIGRRTEPSPAANAPQTQGSAVDVVRAYIGALRDGNPAQASTYLGNGSPDESFIDSATRISSISQSPNGDGSYKVSVDMQTPKGEYYETFTVASGKILDKTAIKP
jgi:hypothetical protein